MIHEYMFVSICAIPPNLKNRHHTNTCTNVLGSQSSLEHPFFSKPLCLRQSNNKKKPKTFLHTFYSNILTPQSWSFEKSKRFLVQGWTLKAKSASECRLLSERRSGSLRRSLVKTAASLAWFFMIRPRSARMRLSCSTSTEFMSSTPERSGQRRRERGQVLNI